MLPGLGAGVTDHSNFFDDPFDRIFRSIPYIWGSIFAADDEQGDAAAGDPRLPSRHQGRRPPRQPVPRLDPDVFWWAHATFTWEFFRARELYFPRPLRRAEREQLYAETVTWYRRYGVSDRPVPPTYDAFRARFDEIVRDELELTPAAAWVLDPDDEPGPPSRRGCPGPLAPLSGLASKAGSEVLRVLVFGGLPDLVRRRFDFAWSNGDRVAFAAICGALRGSGPAIRRGFLADAFPEGTPHLDPKDPTRVVVAGPAAPAPGPRRRANGRLPARPAAPIQPGSPRRSLPAREDRRGSTRVVDRLEAEIVGCRACPRLVAWREQVGHEKRAAYRDDDYSGRPVPGFGDPDAHLVIVGLARRTRREPHRSHVHR